MKKSIAILVLTGGVLFGMLSPQNAIAADNSIVGAWEVEIFPDPPSPPAPFKNLAVFNQDGTTVNSDPLDGTGVGVWKRVRNRSFVSKFKTVVPPSNPDFLAGSFIIVSGQLSFNNEGQLEGPFTIEFTLKDNTTGTATGSATLTRITIGD